MRFVRGGQPDQVVRRGLSPFYIHGQIDPQEAARLERRATFVAERVLRGFPAQAGDLVLDLGTGVGAMAGQLLRLHPGIRVVGLDHQRPALQMAQTQHPGTIYVVGDAMDLPFPDEAFDHVHGSWIIEHLPDPVAGLGEVRRVLRAGGTCWFLEVDNASLRTVPNFPEVATGMAALNQVQLAASGGDPFIGQRLGSLLSGAGFRDVETRQLEIVGSAANPAHFRDFCRIFVDIFGSVAGLVGPGAASSIRAAAERIRSLPEIPGSMLCYTPIIASARR